MKGFGTDWIIPLKRVKKFIKTLTLHLHMLLILNKMNEIYNLYNTLSPYLSINFDGFYSRTQDLEKLKLLIYANFNNIDIDKINVDCDMSRLCRVYDILLKQKDVKIETLYSSDKLFDVLYKLFLNGLDLSKYDIQETDLEKLKTINNIIKFNKNININVYSDVDTLYYNSLSLSVIQERTM